MICIKTTLKRAKKLGLHAEPLDTAYHTVLSRRIREKVVIARMVEDNTHRKHCYLPIQDVKQFAQVAESQCFAEFPGEVKV